LTHFDVLTNKHVTIPSQVSADAVHLIVLFLFLHHNSSVLNKQEHFTVYVYFWCTVWFLTNTQNILTCFCGSPQSLQVCAKTYLHWAYACFLPHCFLCVILYSSCDLMV